MNFVAALAAALTVYDHIDDVMDDLWRGGFTPLRSAVVTTAVVANTASIDDDGRVTMDERQSRAAARCIEISEAQAA